MIETNLKDKVVLITGASRGIGLATAKLFAKQGAKVMLTGRDEVALKEVASSIGDSCNVCAGDLLNVDFAKDVVQQTVNQFGRIDILVCSAGMALRTPTLSATAEEWEEVMKLNLIVPMMLSQACIHRFLQQGGGKIVFVSSTAAKNVNMGATPSYGASKAGLLYLTRHLAREFGGKGVYVNAVCPGPVDTEITKSWTPEHRAAVLSDLPLGRMGKPEEIANAIAYLSSELSDYINGESLLINGGRFME